MKKNTLILILISLILMTFLAIKINQDYQTKKVIENNKIQIDNSPSKGLDVVPFK